MRATRILGIAAVAAFVFAQGGNPFLGRWDLTVTEATATFPDWIEITSSGGGLQALIQPRGGGSYRSPGVKLEGSHLIVMLNEGKLWDLVVENDRLHGTQKRANAVEARVEGVRAPALKHAPPAAWTRPEPLFNGKDLTGWEPDNPAINHWTVRDGELVNLEKGANLKTTRKFDDFRLHIEFNCPDRGNSGVYLRGRYEVQIEYEPPGTDDALHGMGSIYSALAPAVELPRKPGQWESFDATLVGRHLVLLRNGVKTIDADIPGITGGALDSHEAEPGPFYIQGDHTGGLRFRNITISVPR